MTVRNSQIAKHADNSLAVSGKYSRPSLLVQESKRGVNHKRHGDAVNVVERKSARPPRSSAAARTLEEDIFDLIQCEIVRVATQRASMQRASVMKDCGETIVAQMGAASFSNSLDAFGCLMRHRNISQPDRRFLMYTIQAVGFVLGMRTRNAYCKLWKVGSSAPAGEAGGGNPRAGYRAARSATSRSSVLVQFLVAGLMLTQ